MAKKEERKAILQELNLTKDDMKQYWKDCLKAGVPAIVAMNNSELTWKDLTPAQLRQLPNTKNNYLLKMQERERNVVIEEKIPELSFEDIVLQKIEKGERLSEKELQILCLDGYEVDQIEGDDGRWTRGVKTIVELNGKHFAIDWQRALTENQEHEFCSQPYEVEPYEEVITVQCWRRKEEKEFTLAEEPFDMEDELELD